MFTIQICAVRRSGAGRRGAFAFGPASCALVLRARPDPFQVGQAQQVVGGGPSRGSSWGRKLFSEAQD
jgi:hypothetical protein